MGFPLTDITIYYYGKVIKMPPADYDFRYTANYVSDYYFASLNGYKPPKTSRITIMLRTNLEKRNPGYFGSICGTQTNFDEQKYLSLSKFEKYKYLLELIHEPIMELADSYNWDKTVFENAYKKLLETDFKFEKYYPEKKSRDRKIICQPLVTKTQEKSILHLVISRGSDKYNKVLLEKGNGFWYDGIYYFAKKCKWIDKSTFGFNWDGDYCYYSINDDKIDTNINFG